MRPGISPCTMRDRQSLSLFLAAVVGTAVALQAIADPGSPGMVVYDGGKALRQNITSGSPVGVNGETYTDENGGKWQYLRANDNLATQTQAFGKSVTSGNYRGFGGTASRSGSPFIHVNTTGATTSDGVTDGTTASAEPIDADEFYVHPGNPKSGFHFVVLRFTVPEDGWYSAFLTAHDVNGGGALNEDAGAEIRLLVNNAYYTRGVVRLENWENSADANCLTRRFDMQMSVRWMAAGETLDFLVGAFGTHDSDATGLKVFVTKEEEGRFYDAGLAMADNVTNSWLNPFGTDALGMWYYFSVDTSGARNPGAASPEEFLVWAPGNLSKTGVQLLTNQYDRTANETKGFRAFANETNPSICVNYSTTSDGYIAPQMLVTHPRARADLVTWTALRFRPPRSGIYSASIVIRDIANEKGNGSDGVMAYLLVSEKPVTNGVIAAENWNATAHFTFGPRLVAANEPIDIVISPNANYYSDTTCISAIFRREADVYDAGPSLAALDWASATKPGHPFADALGGGATWDIGRSSSVGGSFTTMPYAFKKVSNENDYFGYGAASDGGLPRVMVATNGVANLAAEGDDSLFKLSPNELFAHPDISGSKFPVVRAKVPADGVYHARAYARDIAKHTTAVDGVQLNLLALGYVAAAEIVSIDGNTGNPYPREAVLDGDRLWLKAGDALDAVLAPRDINWSDSTGMSVCYAIESETMPSVVNIDITGASDSTGRISAYTGIGREGWSDWNKWNALRPGVAARAERIRCFEADGLTKRNVAITLVRDSGANIATVAGSGSSALLDNYVSSSDTSDTYTITVGNLKKNEPYTLWLYSAKGNATGNATFTLDGATKGVEETWALGSTKMLTRFDVMSDGNGVITGTFAAADANGGAFNGLTLVGDLPDYVAPGSIVILW